MHIAFLIKIQNSEAIKEIFTNLTAFNNVNPEDHQAKWWKREGALRVSPNTTTTPERDREGNPLSRNSGRLPALRAARGRTAAGSGCFLTHDG